MKSITLTALDIGTSSIKGLCARKDFRTGDIEILAQAQFSCFGVRNGEVVKPEQVSKTIEKIKEELSARAGLRIREALVNIGGSHLFSVLSHGLVSVSRADQKISREDIQRVLRAAQAINLPSNKEVLEVFPREFIIDGEGGIKDPLGLEGIRLEARVLLVCIFSPILENLEQALSEAGLQVLKIVLSPLASSRAVLTPEQKELGVVLVDIGSGTTSIAVFEKGDLIDFVIFPIGSSNITNDIAIGFRTEIQTAERIKREFGSLKLETKTGKVSSTKVMAGKKSASGGGGPVCRAGKEKIEIPEKSLAFSRKFLKNIVESRVSETFSEIQRALKKISGGEPLPSGIVLTGGGSKLPGLVEFTKQRFKLPCCLGSLKEITGIDDFQFSTCAGLLLSGFDLEEMDEETTISEGFKEKLKRVFRIFLP